MLYKLGFEILEKVKFNINQVIYNDCELDDKINYIELRPFEGIGLKNFKERLD